MSDLKLNCTAETDDEIVEAVAAMLSAHRGGIHFTGGPKQRDRDDAAKIVPPALAYLRERHRGIAINRADSPFRDRFRAVLRRDVMRAVRSDVIAKAGGGIVG